MNRLMICDKLCAPVRRSTRRMRRLLNVMVGKETDKLWVVVGWWSFKNGGDLIAVGNNVS